MGRWNGVGDADKSAGVIRSDGAVCLGEPINPGAIMFEPRGARGVVIKSNICSVWGDAHVCEIEYSESSCDTAVLKREKKKFLAGAAGMRRDASAGLKYVPH